MKKIKLIVAIALVIPLVLMVVGLTVIWSHRPEPIPPGSTNSTSTQAAPIVSTIKVALLDVAGTTNGKSRGCDKVVLVNRSVASTTQPLNAALRELFNFSGTDVAGWYNFMAKTKDTLHFDYATVEGGVAKVYLTGNLSGLSGVCDDPRAQIQIEETALQFPTVSSVKIYVDGVETNITPNERG